MRETVISVHLLRNAVRIDLPCTLEAEEGHAIKSGYGSVKKTDLV